MKILEAGISGYTPESWESKPGQEVVCVCLCLLAGLYEVIPLSMQMAVKMKNVGVSDTCS